MIDCGLAIFFIFVTTPLASSWAPYRKPPTESQHRSKFAKLNFYPALEKYDQFKMGNLLPPIFKHDQVKFGKISKPNPKKDNYDKSKYEKVDGSIYFLKHLNMRPQDTFDVNDLKCQNRNRKGCVSYVKNKQNVGTISPVENNNGDILRTPFMYDSSEEDKTDYSDNEGSGSFEDLTRIGRIQDRAHGNVSEDYVDLSHKLLVREHSDVKPEFILDREQQKQLLIELDNALRKPPVLIARKSLRNKRRKERRGLRKSKKTNLNITFTPLKYYRSDKSEESGSDEDDSESDEETATVTTITAKIDTTMIVDETTSNEISDEPVTVKKPILKKRKKNKRNRFSVIDNEKIKAQNKLTKNFEVKNNSNEGKESATPAEIKNETYTYKSDESYGSSEKLSNESLSGEHTTVKPKKKKTKKTTVYMYMQGPQRQYTDSEESRRAVKALRHHVDNHKTGGIRDNYKNSEVNTKKRVSEDYIDYENYRRSIPMFLPKRYFWKKSELLDLGYFWFNGPQGHVPDGRCQVLRIPAIKKPDQPKTGDKSNIVVVPVRHGSSTSAPIFPSKKKEVISEPCVLPTELFEKLKDSKNLLIINNSSEIDNELLEGRVELIFTNTPMDNTIDASKRITKVILSDQNTITPTEIPNVVSNVEMSITNIDGGDVDGYANEYESGQENPEENHKRVDHETSIPDPDIKKQRKIENIMEIIARNKKSRIDEPDSVSAETKHELNKYLEYGTKSKKILDIIKIIKQNKRNVAVENKNKPNININIFKMMKTMTDANEYDSGKKGRQSKSNNNKIKTTTDLSSDSIEKKIELENKKFNVGKGKSSETDKNKKNKLNSESVERNIEYNNNKYHLQNKKYVNDKNNESDIDSSESSEKETKPNNYDKKTKIKLLETNVHSESDSIEKTKGSNTEENKKIKYHESDSTEKLSGETANDADNENYSDLSESDKESNSKKSKQKKKETSSSDDDSDDTEEIDIKPTRNNTQIYKTTLRPKKKQKKDFTYMQGPHTFGDNYLSYEVKNRRSGDETSSVRRNNVINNRRISSDLKNYWSVPFNVLTRKRDENLTYS